MNRKMILFKKFTRNQALLIMFCLLSTLLFISINNVPVQAAAISADHPGSFSELVKKASPSVVNINVEKVVRAGQRTPSPFGPDDPFKDFFDRYFGQQMPKEFRQRGLGTGFIIDKDGLILTNNHVVEGADEIKVRLDSGEEYTAKVIGRDSKTDLALVSISADKSLPSLQFGDSDALEVGDWVVAIGNPFGLGNTVTAGIVSAKYRQLKGGAYDNFIQTDASINPGNSGGPLLNTAGEVIGINSAIFSQSGGNIGIGFAIPINMVKELLPQLKEGKIVRGWLGVMIQAVTPELKEKLQLSDEKGALVADVVPGGPADKAGMKRGDVIVTYDGKAINESRELPYLTATTPIGKTVPVEVMRKGQKIVLNVKIEEFSEEQAEQRQEPEVTDLLGLRVEQLTPEIAKYFGLSQTTGLVIVEVAPNSPAAEAGMQPGDLIYEVDQAPTKDLKTFNQKMESYKPGDTILFLIKRQDSTLYLTLKVGKE